MLQEGRKRDAATNALLALSFAANVAQSPKDLVRSGHVEGPGVQLMSRMMGKRKEANRNLDSGRVSHPARNKTFKEFVEDCDLALIEMTQKQHDKLVARIAKTKNPQRKKELENKFKERVQTQRELILKSNKKPKPKKFSSSPSLATKNLKKVGSKVINSKPMERIKRFVSYTTLGGLAL
jgi:hypothetical protein